MIIERKYEYFWRLISRDPKAEAIYREACYYGVEGEEKGRIYEYNLQNRAFELVLGCGIVNPQIIYEGFAKLDKEEPYDNGFSINDINEIEIIDRNVCEWESPDEAEWLEYAFICRRDCWEHIVKVETLKE